MPNQYVNKVVFGNQTLLDLTTDTVTPSVLMEGYTAHDKSGALIIGTASGGAEQGTVWQDAEGYLHLDDESGIDLQTKSVTPSETAQTVTPDAGYYALEEVNVGAISSSYVGSGITSRSSSDMTVSGATVTAPSGYYSASASKTVASGTAGTPTATKGTVSNHSVSVTPSVTNTTGYITGGTKNGTAVSVSASELVSGTLSITSSGTKDVTNYASASVASGSATASATKGTVSNHSISVTPSVTRTAGYVTAGSSNGTAVSVSASELVSGTLSVTSAGTKDVTNYASASIPSGTAGTPTATKGTVSNHSISVTPSVTNTAGYISGSTKTGTAVTVSASELVSGSQTVTSNQTVDVTNLAELVVAVPSSSPILITKTITENGTYNASNDSADGYSSVTVNVSGGGGGSSGIVKGTFTAGTAGTVQTVNIPYTGNGYPIALTIFVSGGVSVNNSGNANAQTWYDAVHNQAIGQYSMVKCGTTNTPQYVGSNTFIDGAWVLSMYKNSTTNNNSYSRGYGTAVYVYKTSDPTASSATSMVTLASNTVLKVLISETSSGYGFLSGIEYSYYVVYSS